MLTRRFSRLVVRHRRGRSGNVLFQTVRCHGSFEENDKPSEDHGYLPRNPG